MHAVIASILAQTEEHAEEVNEASRFYPEPGELVVGLVAFLILFFFTWKWVLPKFNQVLEERREQIQGEMEKAEATRKEAEKLQEDYRQQLAGAREEANEIIEEARATAEQMRRDLQAKAEEEAQATVARAQEEIGAERDRAFQELRAQIGSIAVELAERVVGQSLDEQAHQRLIDEFIDEVASGASSDGNGSKGNGKGEA
ncbi:MAG TPA: F0F1 ATP synthase subunit B [Actinomycetota bacterium]|nr:F0F1 ATP synthase subunit B [Actinomycetota bacterium]